MADSCFQTDSVESEQKLSLKSLYVLIIATAVLSLCFYVPEIAAQEPRIAIDIGHCAKKAGATSARGIPEYDFNLKMAEALHKELMGVNAFSSVLSKGADCLSLAERSATVNKQKADVFVSIHHNSILLKYMSKWTFKGRKRLYCDKFPGYSVYFSSLNRRPDESRLLAEAVSAALNKAGFSPHNHPLDEQEKKRITLIDEKTGLYKFDSLAVLRGAEMPSILIECGMIVDRNEELELAKPERMQKMAEAVRRGIGYYWAKRGK